MNRLVKGFGRLVFPVIEGGAMHVDWMLIKVKYGFTLAEVLITLGIIGVVAAITIPGLMSKYYEHQTVARMLETQSILTQAIRQAEEENGEMINWGITGQNAASANIIGEKLKPFLKIANDCGISDDKERCFVKAPYSKLNGQNNSVGYALDTARYKFSLMNGTSVSIIPIYNGIPNSFSGSVQINIDTNGTAKPNIIGKDLFMFSYDGEARSLVAMGAPNTIYPMEEFCTKTSAGYGCAYYLLQYKNMKYLK